MPPTPPPGEALEPEHAPNRLRGLLRLNRLQKREFDVRISNYIEQDDVLEDITTLKQIQQIYRDRISKLRLELGGDLDGEESSDAERDIYRVAPIPVEDLWTQPLISAADAQIHKEVQTKHGDILKSVFGHQAFHGSQALAIQHTLDGRDVMVLLPTGRGKSLIYQLPAVVENRLQSPKITIVISPLISLIQDQVKACEAKGIEVISITSLPTNSFRSAGSLWEAVNSDHCPALIYVTPERIYGTSEWFRGFLLQLHASRQLGRFVVDEAHCIVQWGPTFRESYLRLKNIRIDFPGVPIVATTSTLTPDSLTSTSALLRLADPAIIRDSLYRPNLTITIEHKSAKGALRQLVDWIWTNHRHESGIVFRRQKKACEQLATKLREYSISAVVYHGDRKEEEAVNDWMDGTAKVMVATTAFGMGIDKADVRFVVHYDCPSSVESYYQEIGRAGRDGKDADCLLLYRYTDLFIVIYPGPGPIVLRNDMQTIAQKRHALAMVKFAESTAECFVLSLLRHFGEDFRDRRCQTCSNCVQSARLATKDLASLAKDVVALVGALVRGDPSERITVNQIAGLLLANSEGSAQSTRKKQQKQWGAASAAGISREVVGILLGRLLQVGALEAERSWRGSYPGKYWYLKLGPMAEGSRFLDKLDGKFDVSFFRRVVPGPVKVIKQRPAVSTPPVSQWISSAPYWRLDNAESSDDSREKLSLVRRRKLQYSTSDSDPLDAAKPKSSRRPSAVHGSRSRTTTHIPPHHVVSESEAEDEHASGSDLDRVTARALRRKPAFMRELLLDDSESLHRDDTRIEEEEEDPLDFLPLPNRPIPSLLVDAESDDDRREAGALRPPPVDEDFWSSSDSSTPEIAAPLTVAAHAPRWKQAPSPLVDSDPEPLPDTDDERMEVRDDEEPLPSDSSESAPDIAAPRWRQTPSPLVDSDCLDADDERMPEGERPPPVDEEPYSSWDESGPLDDPDCLCGDDERELESSEDEEPLLRDESPLSDYPLPTAAEGERPPPVDEEPYSSSDESALLDEPDCLCGDDEREIESSEDEEPLPRDESESESHLPDTPPPTAAVPLPNVSASVPEENSHLEDESLSDETADEREREHEVDPTPAEDNNLKRVRSESSPTLSLLEQLETRRRRRLRRLDSSSDAESEETSQIRTLITGRSRFESSRSRPRKRARLDSGIVDYNKIFEAIVSGGWMRRAFDVDQRPPRRSGQPNGILASEMRGRVARPKI
ncbi:hypothetical protein MKEN_01369600 [Mycena kentingensis (nom. inval.)]|nr:hypothetical protein MKEN_01369600 [Mycena kentingensis (nom. inval.)]